jgi:uncharacterized protein
LSSEAVCGAAGSGSVSASLAVMTSRLEFAAAFVFFLMTLPGTSAAQTGPPPFSIRVTEQATITAKPDEAQIDVGVTTQAPTSVAATNQNAEEVSRVIAELRRSAGAEATVETVSYVLTPDYRYPREGGEPTIAGYTATNIVRVTLHDLTRVGTIIDAAAKQGANRIHRIDFTLKDDKAARSQALRAAAAKARTQAEALASALGVRIVRVLSAVQGEPPVRPLAEPMVMRAEAASAATPIVPGTLDIHATVTLTLEISEASHAGRRQ